MVSRKHEDGKFSHEANSQRFDTKRRRILRISNSDVVQRAMLSTRMQIMMTAMKKSNTATTRSKKNVEQDVPRRRSAE